MRKRSSRYPSRRDRNLSPILLIGFIVLSFVAVGLLVVTGGGSEPETAEESLNQQGATTPTRLPEEGQAEDQTTPTETGSSSADGSVPVQVQRGHAFIWPVAGAVTIGLGPLHPAGIEIGLQAGSDLTVRAAAEGTVTFVGPATPEDLGVQVVIDHEGNLRTAYGRLEQALVLRGQAVAQGQQIGIGGGAAGGRLHFEVTHFGSQLDPLDLLPAQGAGFPDATEVDCANGVITVESGAPLGLDFSAALGAEAILTRVHVENRDVSPGAPAARASVAGRSSVLFETALSVVDSGQSVYTLIAEAGQGASRQRFACLVVVSTRAVQPPSFAGPTQAPAPTSTGPQPVAPTAAVAQTRTPTPAPSPTPGLAPTPTKTPFPTTSR